MYYFYHDLRFYWYQLKINVSHFSRQGDSCLVLYLCISVCLLSSFHTTSPTMTTTCKLSSSWVTATTQPRLTYGVSDRSSSPPKPLNRKLDRWWPSTSHSRRLMSGLSLGYLSAISEMSRVGHLIAVGDDPWPRGWGWLGTCLHFNWCLWSFRA